MRTSKLLELSVLLAQYAEESVGTRQLMARSLYKVVSDDVQESEKRKEKGNQCG